MEPIPVHVKITVRDDAMTVDYTGTGNQCRGPINSVWAMTQSSTFIILKALLDPFGPSSTGWHDAVTVLAPEGCLVNPRPPAPVFGGGIETGPRIFDVVMRALSEAIPDRVTGASYGTMDTSFLSGTDPTTGEHYIFNDWIPGGWGACHDHDGVNCLIVLCANTDDIPIEITELKYPLRYRFSELITDSGGPGRFRGGLGVAREIEVLSEHAIASLQADRTRTQPWGIFGGSGGRRTRYLVKTGDQGSRVVGGIAPDGSYLSAKRSFEIPRGEILRIESAGGGGYGDASTRERERVQRDVRDGYVSEEAARSLYGYEA
jgi:N-methylhydantoinase B